MEPAGAPICWGKQFGDEDDECRRCNFNISCRPATINNLAAKRNILPQASSYSLPVLQQPQQYATARFGSQLPMPTLPQPTSYPRTVLPQPPQQPTHQAPVGYQPHAPGGWNTPIAYLPRPSPSNPTWWQYQGETTSSRLGKNILLTALQAIFAELLRFFSNWTWPSKLSTT